MYSQAFADWLVSLQARLPDLLLRPGKLYPAPLDSSARRAPSRDTLLRRLARSAPTGLPLTGRAAPLMWRVKGAGMSLPIGARLRPSANSSGPRHVVARRTMAGVLSDRRCHFLRMAFSGGRRSIGMSATLHTAFRRWLEAQMKRNRERWGGLVARRWQPHIYARHGPNESRPGAGLEPLYCQLLQAECLPTKSASQHEVCGRERRPVWTTPPFGPETSPHLLRIDVYRDDDGQVEMPG